MVIIKLIILVKRLSDDCIIFVIFMMWLEEFFRRERERVLERERVYKCERKREKRVNIRLVKV